MDKFNYQGTRSQRPKDQFILSKQDAIKIQDILNNLIDKELDIYETQLELDDVGGRVYKTYVTTGDFTLNVNSNTLKNRGWALIPIEASGNTTTINSNWIKYGGDDFDDTDGAINHFSISWSGEYFYWTNKVVSP